MYTVITSFEMGGSLGRLDVSTRRPAERRYPDDCFANNRKSDKVISTH